ncbi:50S ribosomal protein L18 [Candidatus Gottesmanbacteria bacterium]|nr:50S ribosomal protein L18 [Candidatus Gottesmanbacteria bacterium]
MKSRQAQRIVRKRRIRAKIIGSAARPRLAFYRSSRALVAQVIDDAKGRTILGKRTNGTNTAVAQTLGQDVAKAAGAKKITTMVFDRSGYRYHGVVAAFVDAVRSGGITI